MRGRPLLMTVTGSLAVFLIARLTVAAPLTNLIDTEIWQLTAPAWITGKSLWSTVLSFHAQPPGMIVLQWAEANLVPGVIAFSMLLAAGVFVCGSGVIAAAVTGSRVVGLLTASVIAFQPATLLYSHWFFSSIYLAAFVSLNLLAVFGWARTGNAVWLAWGAFILATASLFHAAYFAAFLIFVLVMLLYPAVRRASLRRPGFAIPLATAAAIALFTPVKNATVYGFFSTSSWGRINIANVYTDDRFIWQKCQSGVLQSKRQRGDFGASRAAAFRETLNHEMLFRPAKPGSTVNLNHLDVLQCADDVRLAERFDSAFAALNILRSVSEALLLPAWDYPWVGRHNLRKIDDLVTLYELFVMRGRKVEFRYYVDIEKRPDDWLESLPSLSSVLLAVTVVFAFVMLLAEFMHFLSHSAKNADGLITRRQIAQVYPCILALLILAIFVFASGQELNRVKFSLTPLFLAAILEALRRCATSEAPAWLRKLPFFRPSRKPH